jgi:hypothetical protein
METSRYSKVSKCYQNLLDTSDATLTPFDVLETSVKGALRMYAGYAADANVLETDLCSA